MKIAVDFDGTIVANAYPNIGRDIPFAIQTLKMLQKEQHQIILWTVRQGALLDEAVEYCRKKGLEFYAVNANYPEESTESRHYSRKINADLFIDDLNIGGTFDWGLVYEMVKTGNPYRLPVGHNINAATSKKKWYWPF